MTVDEAKKPAKEWMKRHSGIFSDAAIPQGVVIAFIDAYRLGELKCIEVSASAVKNPENVEKIVFQEQNIQRLRDLLFAIDDNLFFYGENDLPSHVVEYWHHRIKRELAEGEK